MQRDIRCPTLKLRRTTQALDQHDPPRCGITGMLPTENPFKSLAISSLRGQAQRSAVRQQLKETNGSLYTAFLGGKEENRRLITQRARPRHRPKLISYLYSRPSGFRDLAIQGGGEERRLLLEAMHHRGHGFSAVALKPELQVLKTPLKESCMRCCPVLP